MRHTTKEAAGCPRNRRKPGAGDGKGEAANATGRPTSASGIPVHCACAAVVDIADLKPNPRNPNRHSDEQVALLAKNIRELGWRHPVIVSKRSGLVVAGHARLQAARVLGVATVPVDYQDFNTDADETAYLIADNRIAELAERDMATIKDLLQELDTGETDTDLTGYTEAAIEELMTQCCPGAPVDLTPPSDNDARMHKCPKCGFSFEDTK